MSAADFHNYFGPQATAYAEFRPRYPQSVFDFVFAHVPGTQQAWDAGTGNGQAATGLAERFEHVLATDPSDSMIREAIAHPRVTYRVAKYECELPDHSAQLVSVAQALHWFDVKAFIPEVRRVLQPGGLFAAWCYSRCELEGELDVIEERFHNGIVGPYWPPERKLVDAGYQTIELPIDDIPAPAMYIDVRWSLQEFLAYVRTWSGLRRFVAARGDSEYLTFANVLGEAWGDPAVARHVRWPIHFRAGHLT